MSIYQRIRRRLGHDTATTITDTEPLKDYTVTHTNGETSTVLANGYKIDGAFAKFYEYDSVYVWHLHRRRISGIPTTVRVLDSIQEIEAEQVGETYLVAVVDKADGSVLGSETGPRIDPPD